MREIVVVLQVDVKNAEMNHGSKIVRLKEIHTDNLRETGQHCVLFNY